MSADTTISPRTAFDEYRRREGKPQIAAIAEIAGVLRPYLYAWHEPKKHPRHHPQPADFGAIAAFINVKSGTRFTAQDIEADYLERGGKLRHRRAS
jgi:hypothetical protein